MTTDFTTNPATERELTIQELLLIKHMENIAYQLKLLDKITLLESRITKLEQTIEHINDWEVYSDDKQSNIETKFFS